MLVGVSRRYVLSHLGLAMGAISSKKPVGFVSPHSGAAGKRK